MQNQKSLLDHQITELKKRIDEVEDASSTYKAQLSQQKQLEQQQNQINANEIQKLQNTIQMTEQAFTSKEQEYIEAIALLESQNESLEGKVKLNETSIEAPAPTSSKEVSKIQKQLKHQTIRADDLEAQLVSAKMQWANLDMENEELSMRLQQKNNQLKSLST